jgi:hypothetical protein
MNRMAQYYCFGVGVLAINLPRITKYHGKPYNHSNRQKANTVIGPVARSMAATSRLGSNNGSFVKLRRKLETSNVAQMAVAGGINKISGT